MFNSFRLITGTQIKCVYLSDTRKSFISFCLSKADISAAFSRAWFRNICTLSRIQRWDTNVQIFGKTLQAHISWEILHTVKNKDDIKYVLLMKLVKIYFSSFQSNVQRTFECIDKPGSHHPVRWQNIDQTFFTVVLLKNLKYRKKMKKCVLHFG